MIQIDRHIEILLLSNDCVIVPDFGGFMAHYVGARYNEDEQTFYPPLRTLGFNSQLRLNDSLLAQSYIEAYDISYPEAIRRIADEVNEIKQRIAEQGEYNFKDIGLIRLNEDRHYEFIPCEAGILTPELYGLSTCEMATNDAGHAQTISIKVSTLRNIAAACIAALTIMLFPAQISNSSKQPTANSIMNTELLQRILPKDITTGKPESVKAMNTTPTPSVATQMDAETTVMQKEAETEAVTEQAASAAAFSIVLASQVSQKNANNYVDQLHKKGFEEARVAMTGKTLRVLYGCFPTEADAYNALRVLRQQSKDFSQGWVMNINR